MHGISTVAEHAAGGSGGPPLDVEADVPGALDPHAPIIPASTRPSASTPSIAGQRLIIVRKTAARGSRGLPLRFFMCLSPRFLVASVDGHRDDGPQVAPPGESRPSSEPAPVVGDLLEVLPPVLPDIEPAAGIEGSVVAACGRAIQSAKELLQL